MPPARGSSFSPWPGNGADPVPARSNGAVLQPGFGSPVPDSQQVFRHVLAAMAEPGSVHDTAAVLTPPAPLDRASAAVCLTLLDFETPVWLDAAADSDEVRAWLRFHCGCPLAADAGAARFALLAAPAAMPALAGFRLGSEAYPDESATLVVQVASLKAGEAVTLSGPGIEDRRDFRAAGVAADFWKQRRELEFLFPQGIDLVFASGTRVAAVPRSTKVRF